MIAAVTWLVLALCLSVPFFFSGVIVSLALTRSPYPIGRVYGVDLVGAAFGCLGVLVLLNLTDGPSAVIWVAAVAALAALLFSRSAIGESLEFVPLLASVLQKRVALFLTLSALALLNGANQGQLSLRPIFVKDVIEPLELGSKLLFEKWNSYSRIIVADVETRRPFMWGPSPTIPWNEFKVKQQAMNIDGLAGTYMYGIGGNLSRANFLKYDVTNLAYHIPGIRSGAVIGVGGGRDLLSARVFGVPKVLGVEINPIFVDLLTKNENFKNFLGLKNVEGVSFEVDEARSWFARSRDHFDIIQMSLVDTYAATGAGAFTLTENGLYTVEAWQIILDRLSPEGVFTVSRWVSPEYVNESGRLLSLAVATLLAQDKSDPAQHIFMASSYAVTTLLVSPSPFSENALSRLEQAAAQYKYEVLASLNRARIRNC